MKLSQKQLKQIIQEELNSLLKENSSEWIEKLMSTAKSDFEAPDGTFLKKPEDTKLPSFQETLFIAETAGIKDEFLTAFAEYVSSMPLNLSGRFTQNPIAPPEALSKLAKSPHEHIRKSIAGNKNTPLETLEMLRKDKNPYVKWEVAKNPTWKNELQYQKKEILKKIQAKTNRVEKIILI